MRVNTNLVPDILAALQQSQSTLNTALEQVSTGKSVNEPSDNPAAAADMVQNTMESSNVDQYTKNVTGELSMVQSADSALSSVVTSLTQAVTLGTEGANGTNSTANQQAIAQQVQGILASVVTQANLSYQGTYLFGGTASTTTPYTADSSAPSGYTYNGNNNTNSVAIGDSTNLQVNLPGSQIFSNSTSNVLETLSSLVSALQSGNTSAISTATTAVSTALNYVGQQRVFYANA
ncbi:MAG: flagellar hook-associated protein FlgL, partial [Terracidiphilus sp.]